MSELLEELKQKIDSADTEKLTDIQEEIVKEKEKGNLTDDEVHGQLLDDIPELKNAIELGYRSIDAAIA